MFYSRIFVEGDLVILNNMVDSFDSLLLKEDKHPQTNNLILLLRMSCVSRRKRKWMTTVHRYMLTAFSL